MTDPTASWYEERGRVWLRMEMSKDEFGAMKAALMKSNAQRLGVLLQDGEREKSEQSDIFSRLDDVPTLDG